MDEKGKQTFEILGYDSRVGGGGESKMKESKKSWVKWKEKCISVLSNKSWLNTGHTGQKGKQKDSTNRSQFS